MAFLAPDYRTTGDGFGEVDIVATDPDGTASIKYTYYPQPVIESISQKFGLKGEPTEVIITGSGFPYVYEIRWGNYREPIGTATNVVSPTEIRLIMPPFEAFPPFFNVADSGTFQITAPMYLPVTSTDAFTYIDESSVPTITSVSPSSGSLAGGTTVIITGTNLSSIDRVYFEGSFGPVEWASVSIDSATQITAVTNENISPFIEKGSVTVADDAISINKATLAEAFTYTRPSAPPTVTALAPTSGSTAGGTSVVITGTGFTSATSVTFGATPAANFTVDSATQITATSPPSDAGAVDVVVTSSSGASATGEAGQYTFISAPATPTITASPPTTSTSTSGTLQFTVSSGTAECQLDGGVFSACTNSITYTDLAQGSHTFQVRAVNNGMRSGLASYSWTIDTLAPPTPVVATPPNGSTTLVTQRSVSGTSEAATTLTVYLDGSAVGTTTADGAGNWSFTLTTISAGVHTIKATATDNAGNTSAESAANTFTAVATLSATKAVAVASTAIGASVSITPVTPVGGLAPISYALSGGKLPAGLSFDTASGSLSGMPSEAIASTVFSVTLTDALGQTAVNTFTLAFSNVAPTAANISDVAIAYNSAGTAIDLSSSITGTHTNVAIATEPAHGTVAVSGDVITYTPAAGYIGADSFTYTAIGPGGISTPATVILIVAASLPVTTSTVETLAANTQSNANSQVGVNLSTLVTGRYDAIQLVDLPKNGTIEMVRGASVLSSGTQQSAAPFTAVYKPNPNFVGIDSFSFIAVGPGGSSSPAVVTLTVVGRRPVAADKSAFAGDNQTVSFELTELASEGPFVQAEILSISPPNAAQVLIVPSGNAAERRFRLDVTPAARFSGPIVIRYTLTNEFGVSEPAAVTINVAARPNPATDPKVRALSDAQAAAARRFSQTQARNFMHRSERLHDDIGPCASMDIQLASRDAPGRSRAMPGTVVPNERMIEDNGTLNLDRRDHAEPRSAPAVPASQSCGAEGGSRAIGQISVWTSGTIEVGTVNQATNREEFNISTSGLSAGFDVKVARDLLLGFGGGFGRDTTTVANDAAAIRSNSGIAALYGSYSISRNGFFDFVLGYGGLEYKTRRNIPGATDVALGYRKGDLMFASASAGIDMSSGQLRGSLYARSDFMEARLKSYREVGGNRLDLRFSKRNMKSLNAVIGGRAEITKETSFGTMRPHLRVEVMHEFADPGRQWLDYADIGGDAIYSIATKSWRRDRYDLTVGTSVRLAKQWDFDIEAGVAGSQGQASGRLKIQVSKTF